jgi:feruloyl esterase
VPGADLAGAARHGDHGSQRRPRRDLPTARNDDGRRGSGVLPSRRDGEPGRELRGLAADDRVEREVPGRRERRHGRDDQLRGDGPRPPQRGYATASTDTGHEASDVPFDASWALGRPDLIEDFGHRALHVTTERAKAVVGALFGQPPRYSYYVGCSKGGQQGMMEAQRYPEDYDGLLVGNPAHDWTRFYAGAHLWYSLATLDDPESYIPPTKLGRWAHAVNAACDLSDGVGDGVIQDPLRCDFDPPALTCPVGDDDESCLTAKQVEAVRKIWAGARDSSGELIFPGLVPGGEAATGWLESLGHGAGAVPVPPLAGRRGLLPLLRVRGSGLGLPHLRLRRRPPTRSRRWARRSTRPTRTFARSAMSGGSSWCTTGRATRTSRPDRRSTTSSRSSPPRPRREIGPRRSRRRRTSSGSSWSPAWATAPAVPGADRFDALTALEAWVENGVAPERIVASKEDADGAVEWTRPLCAYPEVARWDGEGDPNREASWACVAPGS